MLQRVVLFQFVTGVDETAIEQHMADFRHLPAAIPEIRSYRAGRATGNDNPSVFDSMHYLTFDSLTDIEIYAKHEAHQAFIARNHEIWANVLALNAEIE